MPLYTAAHSVLCVCCKHAAARAGGEHSAVLHAPGVMATQNMHRPLYTRGRHLIMSECGMCMCGELRTPTSSLSGCFTLLGDSSGQCTPLYNRHTTHTSTHAPQLQSTTTYETEETKIYYTSISAQSHSLLPRNNTPDKGEHLPVCQLAALRACKHLEALPTEPGQLSCDHQQVTLDSSSLST